MSDKVAITLNVNGRECDVLVSPRRTLLQVLREDLHLTGSKRGCNQGVCGACTVLRDGEPIRSCITLAAANTDCEITTVEGLEQNGKLSPVQQAFVDKGAIQCGFCMPGMVIAATALLRENPHPTIDEIRYGLGGNLCRCSGYVKVIDAIRSVAEGGMQ